MRAFFVATLLAGAAVFTASRPASACGGTFCDRGPASAPIPQPMPVDQTGENILFVMDGATVEAHVQIQYTGDPERFAWIVPIQTEPTEISPGSQPLFSNMATATVPRLQQNATQFRSCTSTRFTSALGGATMGCSSGGDADGDFSGAAEGAFFGNDGSTQGASGGGGLEVKKKQVGAFETATLKGGTKEQVLTWLDENDYLIPPRTGELLGAYLERNYVFVALKLTAGVGVEEIHPLVFRYAGDQPCIPLMLTAVAAKEDMAIRAYFLADDRFVPKNYKHVLLNDARFDWIAPFLTSGASGGVAGQTGASAQAGRPVDQSGYKLVVSKAVDSPVANGRAFITEFAGASGRVSASGITSTAWSASPLKTAAAREVPGLLMAQGILTCPASGECTSPYPVLKVLLQQFLPVPGGTTEASFYQCPSCIEKAVGATYDAESFSTQYEKQVLQPSRRAADALRFPYLTRLFTTISPAEMTEDPEFRRHRGLPDVDSTGLRATPVRACQGRRLMRLPSGREVLTSGTATTSFGSTPPPTSWPAFGDDMPWAERIEDFSGDGPPVVLVDNGASIDAAIDRFHASQGWETEFRVDDSVGCRMRSLPRGGFIAGFFGATLAAAVARRRLAKKPRSLPAVVVNIRAALHDEP